MTRIRMFKFALMMTLVSMLFVSLVSVGLASEKLVFAVRGGLEDEVNLIREEWGRRFEELNPGVEVEMLHIPMQGYYDAIRVQIIGGVHIDVLWMGMFYPRYIDILHPLDDLAENGKLPEMIPGALDHGRSQGVLLAIPYAINVHTVMYNQDMFYEAGLSDPSDDWTWDDAFEKARRMTREAPGEDEVDVYGMGFYWPHMVWGISGELFSPDGKEILIDNPVTISYAQLWSDFYSGKAGVQGYPVGNTLNNFLNQTNAMVNRPTGNIRNFRNDATFDWDVIGWPYFEVGGERYRNTFLSPEAWVVPTTSQNPELAKEFISFILQPEQLGEHVTGGAAVPAVMELVLDDFLRQPVPSNIGAFVEAIGYAGPQYYQHPAYDLYGETLMRGDLVSSLWAGEVAASSAVPEIARMINAALEEWYEE